MVEYIKVAFIAHPSSLTRITKNFHKVALKIKFKKNLFNTDTLAKTEREPVYVPMTCLLWSCKFTP